MGTDIHMIAEVKTWDDKWQPVPVPERFTGRNYRFFAAIGDVRNGFGFAGCPTHTPIKPVQSGRGLPEDMSTIAKEWFGYTDWDDEANPMMQVLGWPGEHSEGYATLAELKAFENPKVDVTGWVLLKDYRAWKESGDVNPNSWCGGVCGGSIVKINESNYDPNAQYDENTYIHCMWFDKLLDQGFFGELIAWMETYKRTWPKEKVSDDDVRLLFNFDS